MYRLVCTLSRDAFEPLVAALVSDGLCGVEERDAKSPACVELVLYAEGATEAQRLRARIEEFLQIAGFATALSFSTEPFDADWENAVLAGVEAVQLTPSCRLVPWRAHDLAPRREGEILLKPALAFGFGDHATTRMAAQAIEGFFARQPGVGMLDVGAGTGVLSFVALGSGGAHAVGVEIDPIALENAAENARLNGVEGQVAFSAEFPEQGARFPLVVVNIELPGILATAASAVGALAAGGTLLVTGLLDEQVPDVVACFEVFGLEMKALAEEGGWALLRGSRSG